MAGTYPVMVNYTVNKMDLKIDLDSDIGATASDYLVSKSGLSKSKVADLRGFCLPPSCPPLIRGDVKGGYPRNIGKRNRSNTLPALSPIA